ncbi:MAG: TonB-dependent receptor [Planctomycetes bacterium]|nr:TonB-dependent receptor [Planctomycetota bacterium]
MCSSTLAALLLALLSLPLFAQDPVPQPPEVQRGAVEQEVNAVISRLDTIVVTPLLESGTIFEAPFEAVVITSERLGSVRTLADALRGLPGVAGQRTGYGQSSPYLRGFTGYHTLWMLDGIRLNNSVYRSGPNEYSATIDAHSLERLEVVMGPASVLYGSDAVGGALNALSRRRDPRENRATEVRTLSRYSTAEASITGRVEVSGAAGGVGYVLGTTLAHYGDLDQGGAGRQPMTGYRSGFMDARFDVAVSDNWTAALLVQSADLDSVDRTHRTNVAVPYHGTTVGTDRKLEADYERNLSALLLEGVNLDGAVDRLEVRVSWQELEETSNRIRSNNNREEQGFDVGTFGIAIEASKSTEIGVLSAGLDWYHDRVSSFRTNYNPAGAVTSVGIQGPVGDDASYDLAGLFLQDDLELGSGFSALVGVRATWVSADIGRAVDPANTTQAISLSDDFSTVVGSLRISKRLGEDWNAYAGLSQGFRAPNLSDLSRFDIARSGEVELPSPGLNPEKFLTYEIGAKTESENWTGSLALWHTRVNDMIIRQPTTQMIGTNVVVTKSNAGEGHLQGIDLGVQRLLGSGWTGFGTLSATDGRIAAFATSGPTLTVGPLSRLAPFQGLIGVRFESDDGCFSMQPSLLLAAHQERLSADDIRDTQRIPPGGSPGYSVLTLDFNYRFSERCNAWLSLANLGDIEYRVHGSGQQEAGFNMILGVEARF